MKSIARAQREIIPGRQKAVRRAPASLSLLLPRSRQRNRGRTRERAPCAPPVLGPPRVRNVIHTPLAFRSVSFRARGVPFVTREAFLFFARSERLCAAAATTPRSIIPARLRHGTTKCRST